MKTKSILLLSSALLSLTACGPSAEEKSKQEQSFADSMSVQALSSNAAVENKKDTTHKFIRTADVKFRVKNVFQSTNHIESIVARHGGFVSYTHLNSHVAYVEHLAMSEDSTLERSHYTVLNDMVLRLPNTQLDTVLKEMTTEIDFLDHRTIKAEDVSLQLRANQMAQSRANKSNARLLKQIAESDAKLRDLTRAEAAITDKEAAADQSVLSNLSLNDQINFSTVNLEIYQREATNSTLLANDKNIKAFEPSFGSKLLRELKSGWQALLNIVLFFAGIWTFVAIIISAYFVWKRFMK